MFSPIRTVSVSIRAHCNGPFEWTLFQILVSPAPFLSSGRRPTLLCIASPDVDSTSSPNPTDLLYESTTPPRNNDSSSSSSTSRTSSRTSINKSDESCSNSCNISSNQPSFSAWTLEANWRKISFECMSTTVVCSSTVASREICSGRNNNNTTLVKSLLHNHVLCLSALCVGLSR